jgi:hypothetical protein
MPNRILVTHAVLHCTQGSSDKLWAGVVLAVPGEPAQTHVMYGRRGAVPNAGTKTFTTTPEALRHFDAKMQEKLERHGYHRCDWRDRHFEIRHHLTYQFPELHPLLTYQGGYVRTTGSAALTRPATAAAYPAGIYGLDQEPGWWYVVPEDVGYGYALSPNAMLVERGRRADAYHPESMTRAMPTWVWRATRKSAALLTPKQHPWHRADEAQLLGWAQLELIAAVMG